MSLTNLALAGAALALTVPTSVTVAQQTATPPMHAMAAADVAFSDIEVPGFTPGVKIAVLHGDASVPDKPYTVRLLFPDGYRFPAHWHPRAENVTVLEGTLHLAMGRAFDEAALKTYQVGDYLFIAGEHPHFGKVTGRTVLQLHGVGPFEIHVVPGQEMSMK